MSSARMRSRSAAMRFESSPCDSGVSSGENRLAVVIKAPPPAGSANDRQEQWTDPPVELRTAAAIVAARVRDHRAQLRQNVNALAAVAERRPGGDVIGPCGIGRAQPPLIPVAGLRRADVDLDAFLHPVGR